MRQVAHDLVKRLVWFARDLQASDGEPTDADLRMLGRCFFVPDDDGTEVLALVRWTELKKRAPTTVPKTALQEFEKSLQAANVAQQQFSAHPSEWRMMVDALLGVEAAFATLERAGGSR